MKNRITDLFAKKPSKVLSVFYTAGFPALEDTIPIAAHLEEAGADIIEIGIPFCWNSFQLTFQKYPIDAFFGRVYISEIAPKPVPITTEQPDPCGVSCTTRMPSLG